MTKAIVDNIDFAIQFYKDFWVSPDTYAIIEIKQKVKDNFNVLDSNGISIFREKLNDNDDIDNLIALSTIKGETPEEFIQKIHEPKFYILDDFRKYLGSGETLAGPDVITTLCDTFNARAYLSQPRKSYSKTIDKPLADCNLPKYYQTLIPKKDKTSQYIKFNYISNHQRHNNWCYGLVDIDTKDEDKIQKTLEILKKYGIVNFNLLESHHGYHLFSSWNRNPLFVKSNKDPLNKELKELGTQEVIGYGGDQLVKLESEGYSKLLLYSSTGDESRNVAHPDWAKIYNNVSEESI